MSGTLSTAFSPSARRGAAPILSRAGLRLAGFAYPALPIVLIAATLLPEDLNIRPGGLLLTMPRIVLLLSMPWLLVRLTTRVGAGRLRLRSCDVIVCLTALWMFLAVTMTQGFDRAVVGSSVLILELCGSYALIRISLDGNADALVLARWLAWLIAGNAVLSLADLVTHRHVLHELAQSLTGYSKAWRFDYRGGMLRSQGMQEHPILLGVVCTCGSVLGLFTMRGASRLAVCGACILGLAASNSSAPIGAFLLACLLLGFDRATRGYKQRWQVLIALACVALLLLFAVHPRPLSFMLDHFTANPQDGYYRLLIWHLCGPLVLDSPLFGVGLESDFAARFEVAQTVDTVWLASAMNFGIVGAALIGVMLLSACAPPVARAGRLARETGDLGRALGVIVFLYIYLGLTVDFWGCTWILMGVFTALRVHLGEARTA